MAFVADSRYRGYLGPHTTPRPLEGNSWEDFLHDFVAGVTGMPNDKVFPRWQPEPPTRPPHEVDWAAVGISEVTADWQAYVKHVDASDEHPDGYDLLQHIETTTLLTSFYGPNATRNATYLRSGLFISQNLAELRKAQVGLVEVQAFTNAPELFKQKWVDRVDVPVVFRREIRFDYPVLNLLNAAGTVTGNAPFSGDRTVRTSFNTRNLIADPATEWDEGNTDWDDGNTVWDMP